MAINDLRVLPPPVITGQGSLAESVVPTDQDFAFTFSGNNAIWDMTSSATPELLLIQDFFISVRNLYSGKVFPLFLRQDGIGGRNPTFAHNIQWAGDVPPWLSQAPDSLNIALFVVHGTSIYGSLIYQTNDGSVTLPQPLLNI